MTDNYSRWECELRIGSRRVIRTIRYGASPDKIAEQAVLNAHSAAVLSAPETLQRYDREGVRVNGFVGRTVYSAEVWPA